jgi:hypothetical protein
MESACCATGAVAHGQHIKTGAAARSYSTWRATAPAAGGSDMVLLFNIPALDSVVIHDEINATRPAQTVSGVDLVKSLLLPSYTPVST